jgi:hypothetical protein
LAAGAPRPARPLSRQYRCSLIPSVAPDRRAWGPLDPAGSSLCNCLRDAASPLLRSRPRRPLCKSPSDAFDHHRGFDPWLLLASPHPGGAGTAAASLQPGSPAMTSRHSSPMRVSCTSFLGLMAPVLPQPLRIGMNSFSDAPFPCFSNRSVRPTHSGDKPCLAGSAASAVCRRVGSMVVSRRRC